ncbi:glycosyltransferase family 87 protein [Azospirillum thiophilum]|uniref:glycosyltransferase family 87 protein n=1 Tax=Azospirillum thiophilum TaxID=528244 RepID=UPI000696C519|nr:glycosyltransferase family 87 protein [Azospirillum thiophilum]
MKSKPFVHAADGVAERGAKAAAGASPGRAGDLERAHRFAAWALASAFLFVLCADTLLGVVFRPYLDGGSGDTTVWDVLVLIFAGSPGRLPLDSWEPMMTAFTWLHEHGQGRGQGNVYDAVFFTQHVKFQYPLTSLLVMEAMSAVGLLHLRVYALINLLMVVATAAGMALLMRELAERMGFDRTARNGVGRLTLAALGAVATLCFYPIVKAFAVGQIQVWLNMAFVFAALFFLRDRRALAGALLGASTLIKPQMSLFLVWALVRKEWRFALGWAAVVGPGFAAACALYGLRPSLHYLDVLSFLGQHGESYYSNQTVNGLLHRLLQNGPNLLSTTNGDTEWRGSAFAPYHPLVHAATLLSGILFVLFGLFWRIGGGMRDRMASFLVAGLCFTVGSPISWVPHYGVLLPAFAFLLFVLIDRARMGLPNGLRDLLVLGVAFAIMSNDFFQPLSDLAGTPLNILQSYLFFTALVVLLLLVTTAVRPSAPAV